MNHVPFNPERFDGDHAIDIIVLMVDHFEPMRKNGPELAVESVRSWCESYRGIAERYRDADGRPPQHTWFYRMEYPNIGCLQVLSQQAYMGFGEVEFHLHHGNDTHESFSARLKDGLDLGSHAGAMWTAEPEPRHRFAYIAGNWSLDNGARNRRFSGCNTELIALREAGCYADFTFPALGSRAQPQKTNAIYYATDDHKPKSYNRGIDLQVGTSPTGDLIIFQGPLTIDWDQGTFEDAAIEDYAPPSSARLARLLHGNIHVQGRPEWIFVKLHTHGLQSRNSFLGPGLGEMFEAMSREWDSFPFRLHYVTAREAYNIAKAAEAGHAGNPHEYRDYAIPPPANRLIRCDRPWKLRTYSPNHISLRIIDASSPVTVDLSFSELRRITGTFSNLDIRMSDSKILDINTDGAEAATLEFRQPASTVL